MWESSSATLERATSSTINGGAPVRRRAARHGRPRAIPPSIASPRPPRSRGSAPHVAQRRRPRALPSLPSQAPPRRDRVHTPCQEVYTQLDGSRCARTAGSAAWLPRAGTRGARSGRDRAGHGGGQDRADHRRARLRRGSGGRARVTCPTARAIQTGPAGSQPRDGQRPRRRATSLIVYFDTSAIVPVVVEEPSSVAASRLWDRADRAVSSRLVYAEGRAALAMARRTGRVDGRQLRAAVEGFELLHRQLDLVEITENLVRDAGALAERFALRGHDAVHLASARVVQDPDMVLATANGSLARAARALGMATSTLDGRRRAGGGPALLRDRSEPPLSASVTRRRRR